MALPIEIFSVCMWERREWEGGRSGGNGRSTIGFYDCKLAALAICLDAVVDKREMTNAKPKPPIPNSIS